MNKISSIAIAHIRKSDGFTQALRSHLLETAEIAQLLANKLDLPLVGKLLGLLHDFGKYSADFQKYIKSHLKNLDFDRDDTQDRGKVDHSTAGAQWIYRKLRQFSLPKPTSTERDYSAGELFGQILGLCIASHHGQGLIDCLDPEGNTVWLKRFQKEDKYTHLEECIKNADPIILQSAENLVNEELFKQLLKALLPVLKLPKDKDKIKEFYLGCFTRFLFSCLIDADRINSSDFENKQQKETRNLNVKPDWQQAIDKLEQHLTQFVAKYPIDEIRQQISKDCLKRAQDKQGIYTLTVPTGGGKTLASLRYALHHAKKHNLDRIIYIIPYTSIIDQNAETVRCILGNSWVLEHHSNIEPEKQNWQDKLLSENWDKPIVFTTMVQFLDAWFDGGTRSVRHVHAMTNSMLVFDEIQTLPVKCVHLFCNVLNWLTQFGKSSAVLCTATQPLLGESEIMNFPIHEQKEILARGLLNQYDNTEMIGNNEALDSLFAKLSRVNIQFLKKKEGWSVDDAGEFLLQQFETSSSCLFIVNTKHWAQKLYNYCKKKNINNDILFHLSTYQCAVHRKEIFDKIKLRLKNKEPVICISTQLIEAGVDISMSCVIRALAGLDSIAQAAGRCNRHSENTDKGKVWVLNLQEPNFSATLPDIYIGQQITKRIFREFSGQNILQPKAMQRYFQYYFYQRNKEMSYIIPHSLSGSLLDWLSDNKFNVYTPKNDIRITRFPLLMQSFRSAGQIFQAIDAPTKAVIVPYKEGKQYITELCGKWDYKKFKEILSLSQRYSVNVFPKMWEKLLNEKVIHKVAENLDIYYLIEKHYSNEFGLSLESTSTWEFYNT